MDYQSVKTHWAKLKLLTFPFIEAEVAREASTEHRSKYISLIVWLKPTVHVSFCHTAHTDME